MQKNAQTSPIELQNYSNCGQKSKILSQIWAIHLVRGSKPERKYKIELFICHLSTYQAEKQAKLV